MDLKSKVEYILKKYPYTRNCDTSLSIELWKHFYPTFTKGGIIKLEKLLYMPSSKDIARHRAIIQNNLGKYPATSYKVAVQRNMSRRRWERAVKTA